MKTLPKWIAIVAAAVLLAMAVATLLLRLLVDEDRLRDTLLELVNARIDGELRIDGAFAVSLWPTLALRASDVHLVTPRGAPADLASARELRVGVALWPLLREEVQAQELRLIGLKLDAACDRSGRCNWSALTAGDGDASSDDAPAAAMQAAGTVAAAPLALAIERVRIEDATIGYRNDQDGTHITITQLALSGDDINTAGKPFRVRGKARVAQGAAAGDVGVALQTTLEADGTTSTLRLADTVLGVEPVGAPALETRLPAASVDFASARIHAPRLTLSGNGISAEGSLDADWNRSTASGTIDLKKLDLPAVLRVLGDSLPPTLNADAFGRITLSASYGYAPDRLVLDKLAFAVGDFRADGRMVLGLGDKLRIDATLEAPELDMDYLFPPQEAAAGGESGPASAADETSPAAALLAVDGTIDARIGHLKSASLEFDALAARLVLTPGMARLERLNAGFHGGKLEASGRVDVRESALKAGITASLDGVDLQRLLMATAETGRVTGRLDGTFELSASGNDAAALTSSLNGPVKLAIRDPVITDLSIEEAICKAAATINRESLTARFEPTTRLQSIHTELGFQAGIGQFRELTLVLPNMHMRGDGRIDLPRSRFDVRLAVRITNDLAERDPACRMSRKMLEIDWPLRCEGAFDDEPKKWCGIDKDGLAKIAGQLATEKAREKVEDKLRDKLKGKLGNFLGR